MGHGWGWLTNIPGARYGSVEKKEESNEPGCAPACGAHRTCSSTRRGARRPPSQADPPQVRAGGVHTKAPSAPRGERPRELARFGRTVYQSHTYAHGAQALSLITARCVTTSGRSGSPPRATSAGVCCDRTPGTAVRRTSDARHVGGAVRRYGIAAANRGVVAVVSGRMSPAAGPAVFRTRGGLHAHSRLLTSRDDLRESLEAINEALSVSIVAAYHAR